MAGTKDTVSVLNNLIEVSEDGVKGFSEAAGIAQDARLKLLFAECSRECESARNELEEQVTTLGGEAKGGGSFAGAAQRGWAKIKALVENKDVAVLEEIERGEDRAKAAYSKALKADLPPQVRVLVEKQQAGALRNHDRIRDLRDEFKAARH
jgi:uncharacterized protein (TIGR02284 family)